MGLSKITITKSDLSLAASDRRETMPFNSLTIDLVYLLKRTTAQNSMAHWHEIVCEGEAIIFECELWLTFVKSGSTMDRYIPTLRYVDSEKRCIRELVKYPRKLQQLRAVHSFGAARKRRNGFVRLRSDGEEGDALRVRKVLLLFCMSARRDSESL